jgi:membrane-associated protease RseP (regulator of RpoE activity)
VIVLLAIMVLVLVHEFGHYIAARLCGVRATEFFIGFGPRIWSFRRGDTEYGIKWILVGGYVKILGMNPEEEISPEDFPHSYKGVSYARRFWIIISGSLSHVLLAVLIAFFTIWLVGNPVLSNAVGEVGTTIEESGQETPAYAAGLEPGDVILAMNGEEVGDWEEVRAFIVNHPGEEVILDVERDGQEVALTARLATLDNGNGFLGITPRAAVEHYSFPQSFGETGRWWLEYSRGVFYSIYRVFNWSTLKQLIGLSEPTSERPVTVVGISRIAGQLANQGLYYFLNFMAFLLLFLAYINLLPLPPLDGGHLLVIIWEKLTGKEIDMRKLYPVAVAVLAFFTVLFLLTLRLDLTNPINLP